MRDGNTYRSTRKFLLRRKEWKVSHDPLFGFLTVDEYAEYKRRWNAVRHYGRYTPIV